MDSPEARPVTSAANRYPNVRIKIVRDVKALDVSSIVNNEEVPFIFTFSPHTPLFQCSFVSMNRQGADREPIENRQEADRFRLEPSHGNRKYFREKIRNMTVASSRCELLLRN